MSTMSAVLRTLEHEGLVSIRGRSGTYIGRPDDPCPEIPMTKKCRFQRLRSMIERDIIDGNLDAGNPLPSPTELGRKYGMGIFSVRKSIEALVADSVIEHRNNRYYVCGVKPRGSYSSVLLIGVEATNNTIKMVNDRFREFVTTLETESRSTGVEFKALPVRPDAPWQALNAVLEKNVHIGFIVWATGLAHGTIESILLIVAGHRRPVAIVDEIGGLELPANLQGNSHIRLFTIAAREAGRQTGRYLIGKGHREVAYFSYAHETFWSNRRLLGLHDAYSEAVPASQPAAGSPKRIHEFTLTLEQSSHDTSLPPHIAEILNTLQRDYVQALNDKVLIFSLFAMDFFPRDYANIESIYRAFAPIFGRALGMPTTRAWVACNDRLAVMANHFLQTTAKAKSRIAVMGLDDTREAYQHNVTSYNFLVPHLARRTVAFILNPGNEMFAGSSPIECEGMIVERESTRI
jgi:DNA-binding LacI/PurR family transcriptional regulator